MSRPATNGATGSSLGVKKRKADDELGSEQRLAKRFDLLNLEQNGKLYLPVPHTHPPPHARQSHLGNGNPDTGSMQLDDTKDKIYIHNLDEELADIESDEEKLIFLPDIEKKLAKIPKSVLLGEGYPCVATGNEVVLYSVPSSLTVPEEQDKVRKAIIESRARAREKQLHDAEVEAVAGVAPAVPGVEGGRGNGKLTVVGDVEHIAADQDDEDAMDLG